MRVRGKRFYDATLTFIETDETDGPALTRVEYEHLRELARSLQTREESPDVVLSLPMFDRLLQIIAVELLRESRE